MNQINSSENVSIARRCIVLSCIPIIFCGVLTWMLGYDAPYWDQWWKIPLIVKSFEGTITFGDYWTLINEHRVFFPNLLTIPLARATHWTIGYELALTFLFGIGAFIALCRTLLVDFDDAQSKKVWQIIPLISLLMFSYSQHNIWMWGLHIMIPMTLLAMILSINNLIVLKLTARTIMTAIGFAVIASYSFGAGIVIWGVGVFVLVMNVLLGNEKSRLYLFVWCGACIVTMIVYFVGYESTPTETTSVQAITHPVAFMEYVIAYLGAPLAPIGGWASIVIGFTAIFHAFYLLKSINWRSEISSLQIRMALSLMVLAIGCAVLTGLKQWPEGPDQAISSRYLVWSTLFWIGLLVLSANPRVSKRARQLLGTQVAVLGILASVYGAYRADERHNAFELGKEALLTNTTEIHLLYMYPTLDVPKQMRDDLVHYKLSLFKGTKEGVESDE